MRIVVVSAGHTNVFYVGDRVKQPGQLNGKSANLNHVMLQKIFPGVSKYDEIPPKDIIMVIDCDHCVKPEIFNKMGPCMLDEKVAVTLVPQVRCSSHSLSLHGDAAVAAFFSQHSCSCADFSVFRSGEQCHCFAWTFAPWFNYCTYVVLSECYDTVVRAWGEPQAEPQAVNLCICFEAVHQRLTCHQG